MYFAFNTYTCFFVKSWLLSTYEGLHVYLWSINNGKAIWAVTYPQRRQQGTKLVSSKMTNCSNSSYSSYSQKQFAPR